jgi:hypothetical protein
MQGADISNGMGSAALLQVGNPLESIPSQVSFGAPSFSIGSVFARAQNLVLEGNGVLFAGQTILRSLGGGEVLIEASGIGGVVRLNSVGDIVNTATGRYTLTSLTGGVQLINVDAANAMTLDSASDINILGGGGQAVRIRSDNFTLVRDSGEPSVWLATSVETINYVTGAAEAFSASINFREDLTLRSGVSIVTEDTYLQVGPGLDVGGGRITSVNTPVLSLRTGTFGVDEAISLEAMVLNNASLPMAFNSSGADGAQLQDGHLLLNDEHGTLIAGGDLLINASLTHIAEGNLIVDPGRIQSLPGNTLRVQTGSFATGERISLESPISNEAIGQPVATSNLAAGHLVLNDDVLITGKLEISGDLFVNGVGGCTGCAQSVNPPSDKRVKENIHPISMLDSVKRIMHLDAVSYKFKRAYQAVDKWVGDEVHHGFIAQEVKKHFPFAVKTRKAHGHDDFHSLHKDMIVPDLVNMVKHMHLEIRQLKSQVRHLRRIKKNKINRRGRAKFN